MLAWLNPADQWRAGREIGRLLMARRQLAWELTRRELTEKYAGQIAGAFWAIAHPAILVAVYVVLFAVVFQARIESKGLPVPLDFTVYILCGLLPWLMFQEALNKGTSVIVANASLVKQVVFPIEVLPAKVVLASTVTLLFFLLLLTGYVLVRFHALPWTFALAPALVFVQALAMAGLAYALSAIGCYVRDLRELVSVFTLVNVYLMPVVYLPEWVPEGLRPIVYLNPFSAMTWCWQDALFYGQFRHPWAWVVFPVLSLIIFTAGYRLFRRLKAHFGNVL